MSGALSIIKRLLKSDPQYEDRMNELARQMVKLGYPDDPNDARDFMRNALSLMDFRHADTNPTIWSAESPGGVLRALGLTVDNGSRRTIESLGAWPQRGGHGSAMMKAILEARDRPIDLMSEPRNFPFYQRFGFEVLPDQNPDEDYFRMLKKRRGGLVQMKTNHV